MSQRTLSRELGISLGAVNFCLNSLIEKGHLKIKNFRVSNKKSGYAYVLTPKGITAKAALTGHFLRRKLDEYDALKAEIESLQEELELGADMGLAPHVRGNPQSRK